MSENDENEHQGSQSVDSSKVELNNTKHKHAGGRPRKVEITQGVQEIINLTAPAAALILQAHIERKRSYRTLRSSLQRACEYVIDHAIGKARQKVEHSGGILTYRALADGADKLDKHPRPILADVLDIANKYDREHPEAAPKPASSEEDKG